LKKKRKKQTLNPKPADQVDYMTYECPVYFRFDPRKRGMTAAQPNFM
jgi:hypothetical protein